MLQQVKQNMYQLWPCLGKNEVTVKLDRLGMTNGSLEKGPQPVSTSAAHVLPQVLSPHYVVCTFYMQTRCSLHAQERHLKGVILDVLIFPAIWLRSYCTFLDTL